MKPLYILVACLCIAFTSFSQSSDSTATKKDSVDIGKMISDMFNADIDIDVDKSVFDSKLGKMMYMSTNTGSVLMIMLVPQSIDKAEENIAKQRKKDGYKRIDNGNYVANGKKVVFEKGTMKKDGTKMQTDMYMIEATEKASIFVIGVYLPKIKDQIAPLVKKAADSAKLPVAH